MLRTVLLLVLTALAGPAREHPCALSATRVDGDDPNQWRVTWRIGSRADAPHDILVLAGATRREFEVLRRFPAAGTLGSEIITLAPEYRWLSLQATAELGGDHLGPPLDLEQVDLPAVDLAELHDRLAAEHPELAIELHRRDPVFAGRKVLTIGPLGDETVIALDLPWTPTDTLALSHWFRVRGRGAATVSCRPVSVGGVQPDPHRDAAPAAAAGSPWQFRHIRSSGDTPGTTTHFRLLITPAPGADGAVRVDLCDLRLARQAGPPPPAHASLLGRIPGTPTSMAFFEDSDQLVIGFAGSVAVFDPGTQRLVGRHQVGSGTISWVGGTGSQIYAIDATPALWRVDLERGTTTRLGALDTVGGVAALARNGSLLATSGSGGVHVWSVEDERLKALDVKPLTGIESLAFEEGSLRICTTTKSALYDPETKALSVPRIHGQTGFARPVFNHSQRIWTDPARRKYYTLQSESLELFPPEAGRPGPAFPAGLRAMVVRPGDGTILLADRYGQLWSHPPLPVPAAP